MHPIVADQIASHLVEDRLREAAAHRRVGAARPRRSFRARQAQHLVALARRLDPGVDRSAAPRAATAR